MTFHGGLRFVGGRLTFLTRLDRQEHLHQQLSSVANELWGIDRDQSGLSILRTRGFGNLFVADVEQLDKAPVNRDFDLILAPELIEHLGNPKAMLEGVKRFMRDDSLLLVTTPNALSLKFFLHACAGVEMSGPDHVLVFSPRTLERLLERQGFRVVEMVTGLELHQRMRNRLSAPIFGMLFKLLPQFADVIIAVARLENYDQRRHAGLQLRALHRGSDRKCPGPVAQRP